MGRKSSKGSFFSCLFSVGSLFLVWLLDSDRFAFGVELTANDPSVCC